MDRGGGGNLRWENGCLRRRLWECKWPEIPSEAINLVELRNKSSRWWCLKCSWDTTKQHDRGFLIYLQPACSPLSLFPRCPQSPFLIFQPQSLKVSAVYKPSTPASLCFSFPLERLFHLLSSQTSQRLSPNSPSSRLPSSFTPIPFPEASLLESTVNQKGHAREYSTQMNHLSKILSWQHRRGKDGNLTLCQCENF